MPKKIRPKVFLDANVVIAAGKPPGGPIMARLAELAGAGLIDVLTTDLTIIEVAKKHVANDYKLVSELARPHVRAIVSEVFEAELPSLSKAAIKEKLFAKYLKGTNQMFTELQADRLAIDAVKPSRVFLDYAKDEGFFSGEGKKEQFPDAFIFECIKTEATEETPVVIVSDDGDFTSPAKAQPHITLVKSITALFTHLGLEYEPPRIGRFLKAQHVALIEAADRELADWGLIGDVEDAEIHETRVTDVKLGDVSLFKAAEEFGSILLVGSMKVFAEVSYTHPDWDTASYDSEDKVAMPWRDVSGEAEVKFDVDVSMEISTYDDGSPYEIEALDFRDSDFQYVTLYPPDNYK